jgi:hypothetical protein
MMRGLLGGLRARLRGVVGAQDNEGREVDSEEVIKSV